MHVRKLTKPLKAMSMTALPSVVRAGPLTSMGPYTATTIVYQMKPTIPRTRRTMTLPTSFRNLQYWNTFRYIKYFHMVLVLVCRPLETRQLALVVLTRCTLVAHASRTRGRP